MDDGAERLEWFKIVGATAMHTGTYYAHTQSCCCIHAHWTVVDSVSSLSGLVLCMVFGPNLFFFLINLPLAAKRVTRAPSGAKTPGWPFRCQPYRAADARRSWFRSDSAPTAPLGARPSRRAAARGQSQTRFCGTTRWPTRLRGSRRCRNHPRSDAKSLVGPNTALGSERSESCCGMFKAPPTSAEFGDLARLASRGPTDVLPGGLSPSRVD